MELSKEWTKFVTVINTRRRTTLVYVNVALWSRVTSCTAAGVSTNLICTTSYGRKCYQLEDGITKWKGVWGEKVMNGKTSVMSEEPKEEKTTTWSIFGLPQYEIN